MGRPVSQHGRQKNLLLAGGTAGFLASRRVGVCIGPTSRKPIGSANFEVRGDDLAGISGPGPRGGKAGKERKARIKTCVGDEGLSDPLDRHGSILLGGMRGRRHPLKAGCLAEPARKAGSSRSCVLTALSDINPIHSGILSAFSGGMGGGVWQRGTPYAINPWFARSPLVPGIPDPQEGTRTTSRGSRECVGVCTIDEMACVSNTGV